jgi:hypothetical protein
MICTISLMTVYAHCRRKGKRADQVQVQVGANQVKSASKKRSDILQLGQQARQSIPPLRVLSKNVPSLVQRQSLEEAKKWAAEWNMSVEDVLSSKTRDFARLL